MKRNPFPESYVIHLLCEEHGFSTNQCIYQSNNFNTISKEEANGFTVVKVQYKKPKGFKPPARWFIKDNQKIDENPQQQLETWEGNVYLIRKGLSWQEIR